MSPYRPLFFYQHAPRLPENAELGESRQGRLGFASMRIRQFTVREDAYMVSFTSFSGPSYPCTSGPMNKKNWNTINAPAYPYPNFIPLFRRRQHIYSTGEVRVRSLHRAWTSGRSLSSLPVSPLSTAAARHCIPERDISLAEGNWT